MISPETTDDILAEIARALTRLADKFAPEETAEQRKDRLDPYHDEGNATNRRLSQCGPHCAEPILQPIPPTPGPNATLEEKVRWREAIGR